MNIKTAYQITRPFTDNPPSDAGCYEDSKARYTDKFNQVVAEKILEMQMDIKEIPNFISDAMNYKQKNIGQAFINSWREGKHEELGKELNRLLFEYFQREAEREADDELN